MKKNKSICIILMFFILGCGRLNYRIIEYNRIALEINETIIPAKSLKEKKCFNIITKSFKIKNYSECQHYSRIYKELFKRNRRFKTVQLYLIFSSLCRYNIENDTLENVYNNNRFINETLEELNSFFADDILGLQLKKYLKIILETKTFDYNAFNGFVKILELTINAENFSEVIESREFKYYYNNHREYWEFPITENMNLKNFLEEIITKIKL